jgi:hypothetical protein
LNWLLYTHLDSVLLLVGGFNRPKLNKFAAANGLSHIVKRLYSRFSYVRHVLHQSKCSIVSASVLSDHKALVICGIIDDMIFDDPKPKMRKTIIL